MVAKQDALLGCVCFVVAINSMEKINKRVLAAVCLWQQRNAEKSADAGFEVQDVAGWSNQKHISILVSQINSRLI